MPFVRLNFYSLWVQCPGACCGEIYLLQFVLSNLFYFTQTSVPVQAAYPGRQVKASCENKASIDDRDSDLLVHMNGTPQFSISSAAENQSTGTEGGKSEGKHPGNGVQGGWGQDCYG